MASFACTRFLRCTGLVAGALLCAALGAPGTAGAQSALRLGPANTNTYVTFGSTSALGLSTFTVETWFNRQGAGVSTSTGTGGIAALVPLVTKGAAQSEASNVDANWILGINTAGDVIAADFEEGALGASPGQNHPISGVTPIQNGTWYHAAATYDGATFPLYLNGELEAELVVGQPTRSDSIQHAALGTTLTSTGTASGFFDGTLDEARVWNTARTGAEIRSTMNVQGPSDATLVARWGLDENGGTTIGDSAGTAQNGTITNTNYSWVANGPFDVAPCADTSSSMLRFDGSNDYVTFGNAAELGLSVFTIETWFKREGTGSANTTGSGGIANLVPLVSKGAPESDGSNVDANWILGINTSGNVLAADFEDTATGLNHPVSGTTPITNNNWHHAAATYDGSTWVLYLDGNLEATLVVGAFTPRADSIQYAALGAMLTSTGSRLGAFAGLLDEVRVWSVVRSQTDIQNNLYAQLTSGTGLVARWGLGEGSGTTIADSVGSPATSGTLTNGPVWTASNSLFDATAACDDGLFCTGADTCSGTGANGLRCSINGGDPCTGGGECADDCNEATDSCFDTAGTPCSSDGNVCTDDVCDGAGGCGVNNSAPCDDATFCNGADTCGGGACTIHAGDPCSGGSECADDCNEAADSCFDLAGTACSSDGNVCTDDVCDGAGGCGVNNSAPCNDGTFCNGADTCSGGACAIHPGDPCTGGGECADACDEGADTCFDAAATPCTEDGNACTDDQCDGAGTCTHPNNTASCNDGLFCTVNDVCGDGSCTGTPRDCSASGDQCRIGTCDEALDECTGPPKPDGTACDDDDACTTAETCTAGSCGGGGAVVCGACETCDSGAGCQFGPRPVCTSSLTPLVSKLLVKDATTDLVSWKLRKGPVLAPGAFGDPVTTDGYTLCVFDQGGSNLAFRLAVPAGGTCGTVPCWRALSSGFRYSDRTGTSLGTQKILLKSAASQSSALVKGKGANLPPLNLPLTLPVVTQLQGDDGACFETTHSTATRNDGSQFKSKDD